MKLTKKKYVKPMKQKKVEKKMDDLKKINY